MASNDALAAGITSNADTKMTPTICSDEITQNAMSAQSPYWRISVGIPIERENSGSNPEAKSSL